MSRLLSSDSVSIVRKCLRIANSSTTRLAGHCACGGESLPLLIPCERAEQFVSKRRGAWWVDQRRDHISFVLIPSHHNASSIRRLTSAHQGRCVQSSTSLVRASHYTESCV